MTVRRLALLVVLALLGFGLTDQVVKLALSHTSYPHSDTIADRADRVLSDPAVDTVFIGTSRTENMVDPDVYDDAMARRGYATHSYVAGMSSMSVPEIEPLLRRILDAHPCCLKIVFIEPDFAAYTPARLDATERSIHFYSLRNTISMLDYIAVARPNSEVGTKAFYIAR